MFDIRLHTRYNIEESNKKIVKSLLTGAKLAVVNFPNSKEHNGYARMVAVPPYCHHLQVILDEKLFSLYDKT